MDELEKYYVELVGECWVGEIHVFEDYYKFIPIDREEDKQAIADLENRPQDWYPPFDITVGDRVYSLERKKAND
jgi:hypothetical protein